jgi:transcriptional regulator with XRE-family HTH domain
MEKNTMGAFIAALRKASGMTQKELAERLNVSDKSVSRWERDETAPDLTLIPVIAEVFGVTADELLRGERRPAEKRDAETEGKEHAFSARSERELERLLKRSLTKFKINSIISVSLAALGFILSAILFFSLNHNYDSIPTLAGSVLLAAGLVCEIIFTIKAVAAANDAEVKEYPGAALYMKKVTWTAAIAFMAIFLVLASCIGGSIDGLMIDNLVLIAFLFFALLLCGAACIVIKGILNKR